MFVTSSVFISIEKYYKWKRHYDAGLATADLNYYSYEEKNSFCGRSLSEPMVHRYSVLQKFCSLSEIPYTHTTIVDIESSCHSKFDPLGFYENDQDSESESSCGSKMSKSLSVPNVEKLDMTKGQSQLRKTMYSVPKSSSNSELKFGDKVVELTHTSGFSVSSGSSQ